MRLGARTRRFGMGALVATLVVLAAAACGGDDEGELGGNLILATTTSVNDSGLLEDLVPLFEDETGVNVQLIAIGTGAALRMAEEGNADVLLVHAPDAERALVEAGDLQDRRLVAYNDFLLVGPADDPAGVAGERDVETALTAIAAAESRFLSRGDDSGTHKKELALWAAAGIEPGGGWYLESGQGMGASLTVADQREAYILTDRGAFLALRGTLELVAISEGDPALLNFYSVALVNPAKGRINAHAAAAWAVFLLRADVQNAIGAFRREEFGRSLFIPAAGQSEDAIATVIAAEAGNSATSDSTANDEE